MLQGAGPTDVSHQVGPPAALPPQPAGHLGNGHLLPLKGQSDLL